MGHQFARGSGIQARQLNGRVINASHVLFCVSLSRGKRVPSVQGNPFLIRADVLTPLPIFSFSIILRREGRGLFWSWIEGEIGMAVTEDGQQ